MKKTTTFFIAALFLLGFNSFKSTGQALNFAAYSFIDIGDILPNNQSYTKEAWIRVYTYHATHGSNILSAYDHPFWLENGVLSAANSYSSTSAATVTDTGGIALNTWIHVAVTYDASTTTMKLYKNGVLIATNTQAPTYMTSTLQIGAQEYGDFFDGGDIDEVRLWNIARTQAQIVANMNCDVPQQSNLVAYYRFNQGTPGADNTAITSVYDYSGNANCGTLYNFNMTGSTSNYIAGAIGTCSSIGVSLSAPASITGASSVCTGSTIALSNTTTGGLWLVDDLDTASISSTGVVTGNYGGTVTISYKTCGGIATKTITVNPSPVLSATASNGTIATSVTGGTSGFTYAWTNSTSTSSTRSGLSTGTYTVTVTDAKGCKDTGAYYVTQAVILTNTITVTPCNNTFTGGNPKVIYLGYGPQCATLNANTTGASNFTYSWYPTAHLSSSTSKNPVFTPTAAGTYTYTCTATSGSTSVSATVTMTVYDAVDHCHSGKVYVCHFSGCNSGHGDNKSITCGTVSTQLCHNRNDYLGQYRGSKQTKTTDVAGLVIVQDEMNVSTSPNPFTNEINIKLISVSSEPANIVIYDMNGKVVETILNSDASSEITAGSKLQNGMYLMEVKQGNISKKIKIVKN